ncbi:MAG: hypothetical protein NC033_05520 [Clostridiales bacterium]|nr:hypothetical protein [Clostridiales bacterium]
MKNFNVEFCLCDSEYMTALRLAVGAVCAVADVGIDSAEDMKVCVTESCLILKGCGFEGVKISLGTQGGVHAVVEGTGGNPCESDNDFSLALVSALVTDCALEKTGGAISKLTLKL